LELDKVTQRLLNAHSVNNIATPFYKDPVVIGLVSNVGLLLGNILGYWSFAETLFTYIYEILLFTVLAFIYLTAKGRMHNPGYMLMGGFFIIAIAFGCTLGVSISIGEIIDPPRGDLILSTFHQVKHIWPIFFILTISGIIAFFDLSAKDRELSLQTTLFYKIFLVAAIIAGALLFVYSFGIKSKLVIVIITIIARIGLDYYLNPAVFKSYLKKIGINL
jgi:hypothetical protein